MSCFPEIAVDPQRAVLRGFFFSYLWLALPLSPTPHRSGLLGLMRNDSLVWELMSKNITTSQSFESSIQV